MKGKAFLNGAYIALIFALLLVLSPVQLGFAQYAEPIRREKALSFLENVVQLDLSKYEVKTITEDEHMPPPLPVWYEEVSYMLKTGGGWLDVGCLFVNDSFIGCRIYKHDNVTLHYTVEQPTNLIDKAKGLLKRYGNWIRNPLNREMELLEKMVKVDNVNITSDDMDLRVSVTGILVDFQWILLYGNGLELRVLTISFEDYSLYWFTDFRDLYKVGSITLKVSKEDAIEMALSLAKNFSWKVGETEIKDFVIKKEPIGVELTLWNREPYTFYPHWRITLFLDKVYPGGVTGIQVGIWADTGEIHYIIALSTGGGPPPQDSSTPSPEPEPAPSPQPSPQPSIPMEYSCAIIAITILAVTAASSYLYIKRKRDRNKT